MDLLGVDPFDGTLSSRRPALVCRPAVWDGFRQQKEPRKKATESDSACFLYGQGKRKTHQLKLVGLLFAIPFP
jgi:hypothetical protein